MAFVTLYISASIAALVILYIVCFVGSRGRHFPGGMCWIRELLQMYRLVIADVNRKDLQLYQ
jgi:hypothetical protein